MTRQIKRQDAKVTPQQRNQLRELVSLAGPAVNQHQSPLATARPLVGCVVGHETIAAVYSAQGKSANEPLLRRLPCPALFYCHSEAPEGGEGSGHASRRPSSGKSTGLPLVPSDRLGRIRELERILRRTRSPGWWPRPLYSAWPTHRDRRFVPLPRPCGTRRPWRLDHRRQRWPC